MNEPIGYAQASAHVRAVDDDIMATRKSDWVNNYWKVLAHHPPTCGACGRTPRKSWDRARSLDQRTHLYGGQRDQRLPLLCRLAWRGRPQPRRDTGTACQTRGRSSVFANETNRHAVALDLQIDDKFR
jgi:hypothetical protein